MCFVSPKLRFKSYVIFRFLFFSVLLVAESAAREPLLVRSDRDYSPFTTVDNNGKLVGLCVDLLKEIAKAEVRELEWGANYRNKNLKLLQSGKVDLLPMTAKSTAWAEQSLFGDSLMVAYDDIFVRKGDDLISIQADIQGHPIIVVRENLDHGQLRIVETVSDGMSSLAAGEASVMETMRLTGLQTLRNFSIANVDTLAIPIDWYSKGLSIAVSQYRPEFLAPFNRGLANVRADETEHKLLDNWFAQPSEVTASNLTAYKILYFVFGILAGLIFFAGVSFYSKRGMVLVRNTELLQIADKKLQVENTVVQNERLFDGDFDSGIEGLMSLDGEWLKMNQEFCMMQDVSQSKIVGTNIKTVLDERGQKEFTSLVRAMLADKIKTFSLELRFLDTDSGKWVRAIFSLLAHDEDQGVQFIHVQIQNINQEFEVRVNDRKDDEKKLDNLLYDLKFLQTAINRHAIVSRTNAQGIITYVNDNFCKVSQYSAAELIGQSHNLIKSNLYSRAFYRHLWITISSGKVWEGVICNRKKDNSLYWVHTTIVPHIGIGGKPDSFLSVRTDITKQKKAEAEIRYEREFMHAALQHLKDGIVVFNKEGQVNLINAAGKKYLGIIEGYPEGVLKSGSLADVPELQQIINNTIEGTTSDDLTVKLSSSKKSISLDFQVNAGPIMDKTGLQLGSLLSMHDVTERLFTEQQLIDSNIRFKAFFDNKAIAIEIFDGNNNLLSVNSAYEKMFGYSLTELKKPGVVGITHPDERSNLTDEKYQDFINNTNKSYQVEKRYLHKDGSVVWGQLTVLFFGDFKENKRYMMGMIADITREKFMEEDRYRLRRQLTQAEKMEAIGSLTAGISHDFNNILASIMGYTDLMLMKFGTEPKSKLKQYLTEVYKAGERAQSLIAQMMDFSTVGGGNRSNLAVEPTIKAILKMLSPTLPSGILVNYDSKDKNLPNVSIDAVRLHQIIMNLIVNARDAIKGKGEISISLNHYKDEPTECLSCHDIIKGEYLELSVSDTGTGMAASDLERIFDPFYTTKGVGMGTGMGLSVIHGIVHGYDGHILVESELGVGSMFRILFEPVAPIHVQDNVMTESLLEPYHVIMNIMVVDDEVSLTSYLEELLTTVGHHVSVYNSSKEALADFTKSPSNFDIVITDQTMPYMLGVDLITAMKQVRPELPFILCTGYTELNAEDLLRAYDFVHLLTKPINRAELFTIINSINDVNRPY